MSRVEASPEELHSFASRLSQCAENVGGEVEATSAAFNALSDTWRDEKRDQFEEVFTDLCNCIMKIINIGILAHVDAGKTTLTESLLYASGAISEPGSVEKGTTRTDTMFLERQRGITIQAAVTSFQWHRCKVNIVDTPGHMDFLAEVYRSLAVLDGAILVISAKDGVQAQTRILFHALRKMNIPTVIFINKIDQAGVDLQSVVQSVRDKLSADIIIKQGRGGAISFLVPGQQRATRLRSSTLGEGYDPEDIRAVIAGKRPLPEVGVPAPAAPARVNLIVDIQERLRDRKGPAYERWAKIYNLKQMAAALQFMQEHGLTEYNQLAAQTEEAVQRFHVLTGQLRQTEANLAHTSEVMGAVVQYAKTRPVFDGYKATKYSKKYLAAHEAELADYRAAKAILNDLLDGARLPRMPELKEKRRTLAAQKKTLYADYRAAQQRMREAVAVKANIDHLLGLTDQRKNKEQER